MRDGVFVAVHHYQDPSIVARADLVADSYRLAAEAAKSGAPYVVVCGVRFMAESVAALAGPEQRVIHPAPEAGCPMADMIDLERAERALKAVRSALGRDGLGDTETVPLTYMNSSLSVKALTGREGGAVCTSGNARALLSHYLERGKRVFFMPDANLALNTARDLGLGSGETAILRRDGSLPEGIDTRRVKLFAWNGFCPVHRGFLPRDLAAFRAAHPGARILVHPECVPETARAADRTASTEGILREVASAAPGTQWGIGTEIRFVERLAASLGDRLVLPLRREACPDMALITPKRLEEALAAVAAHRRDGASLGGLEVAVSPTEREGAAKALEAMMAITEAAAR